MLSPFSPIAKSRVVLHNSRGHRGKRRVCRTERLSDSQTDATAANVSRNEAAAAGAPRGHSKLRRLFCSAWPLSSVGLNDSGGKYVSRPLCDHHCHEVTAGEGGEREGD